MGACAESQKLLHGPMHLSVFQHWVWMTMFFSFHPLDFWGLQPSSLSLK